MESRKKKGEGTPVEDFDDLQGQVRLFRGEVEGPPALDA